MFELSYIVTQHLWLGLSFFMIAVFILNRINLFRRMMLEARSSLKGKLFFIAVFSLIGIVGTYWGIKIDLGIINTRAVGVVAGGLLGGPVVGGAIGLVVGLHRSVFMDSFTAGESGLITFLQGFIAGLLSNYVKSKKEMWPYATAIGLALEALHMLLLLVFAEPLDKAFALVGALAPPMLLANPLAIGIFIGILEDAYKRHEKIEGTATKTALYVANLTMAKLHSGFDEKSAGETVRTIIGAVDNFDCVAFLSNKRVLALAAKEEKKERKLAAFIESVIGDGFPDVLPPFAPIKAQIIVPIHDGDSKVGSLLFGTTERGANSTFEEELAAGLASLISAQMARVKVREQAKLLASAELKALQSQINPHFLFNALNTIGFYCREQPLTAKKLLTNLADYYRHNLYDGAAFIPLSQEMQHINAYVSIEEARFGDRLHMQYEIAPDCDFKLPALIVQPLVENAIKHGIQPKAQGGRIKIKAVKQDTYYELTVEDDGVGMDKRQIKTALYHEADRTSIGLANVNKRLLIIYGPDNGLDIKSGPNEGTIVSLRIPAGEVEIL